MISDSPEIFYGEIFRSPDFFKVKMFYSPVILYVLRGVFYTKKVREHSLSTDFLKLSYSYKCLMP